MTRVLLLTRSFHVSLNYRPGPKVAPHHFWVVALLPFIGRVLAVSAQLQPTVEWRGRSYRLDRSAKLGVVPDTDARPTPSNVLPLTPR